MHRLHQVAIFNPHVHVILRGIYRQVGDIWQLTHWQVLSKHATDATFRDTLNNWYKVHGNQKKDLGGLKLVRWSEPQVDARGNVAVSQSNQQATAELFHQLTNRE